MNRMMEIRGKPLRIFNKSFHIGKIPEVVYCLLSALTVGMLVIRINPWPVVFISAGIFFLIVSVRRPEIGILMITVLISSIVFEESLPLIPIPGGSFHATDIILIFFILLIPFQYLANRNFRLRTTSLDTPLLLFILAVIISAGISIFGQGVNFNTVMRGFRPLIYYLLYFVMTNFIRSRRQIHFVYHGLFVIAGLVSLLMIIQAGIGASLHLISGRVAAARALTGQSFEATRILPPGDTLIFIMFISAVCAIAIMHGPLLRSGYFYLLILLGSGLVLTYTRNYWISVILSLLMLVLLASKRGKRRILGWLLISLILIVITIPPFISFGGRARSYFDSISERIGSMLAVKRTFASGSLVQRKIETEYAWKSIAMHPLLGIGLNSSYRPRISWIDYKPEFNSQSYIHNGYLYILVYTGLLGFIPFMWFYGRFIQRGFSNWRKIKSPLEKSIVIGCTLSGIALSLSFLVSPKLMEWPSIVVIAIVIGLMETTIQCNEREGP
jgi:O-antigen ligase